MKRCLRCRRIFEKGLRVVYRDGDTFFEGVKEVCPYCRWDEFKEVEK